jgi:hypothetical protein
MIWNLIGTTGGKVLDIVDDVVENNDEANKLKFQIQKQLLESKGTKLEAQAKVILAEAQGPWLQHNWSWKVDPKFLEVARKIWGLKAA